MKIESVFVTGANRGVGLEFVRQLSQYNPPPNFIFATYRNPDNLQDLKDIQETSEVSKIVLIKLDVAHPEEVEVAKQIVEQNVGDKGLGVLINNAGINRALPFPNITAEDMKMHFEVNTIGPTLVFQALFPLLEKAAAANKGEMSFSRSGVLNMSSMTGSIQRTGVEFLMDVAIASYKTSKAALNMMMRIIGTVVKDKGILVVNMCPGWVKTDMGGRERGKVSVEDSVGAMLNTMAGLNESHHSTYMDRDGNMYAF